MSAANVCDETAAVRQLCICTHVKQEAKAARHAVRRAAFQTVVLAATFLRDVRMSPQPAA